MDSGSSAIPIFPAIPIIPVIPAKAGIYTLRWTPVLPSFQFSPSFRRKPESTRCDRLRFSPERRAHTNHPTGFSVIPAFPPFQFFPVIPAKAGIYALRWTPVFARATGPHQPPDWFSVIPAFPSFQFSRHSGFRRNLHAAIDSGFRPSDGPTPTTRKETLPTSQPSKDERFRQDTTPASNTAAAIRQCI